MKITKAPELPPWLASMVPFQRYSIEVDGWQMHVMEAGNPSGRPVLMLHGNPTWGFLYRKVAGLLANGEFRIVMPDLLGLGYSAKPPEELHTLTQHAAWMTTLVEKLGLDRLIFVGQDWGGPIGLCALAPVRQRVSGLVILNTVVGPPRPGFRPATFHRFANAPLVSTLVFRYLGFPQNVLAWSQGDRKSISGYVARAYRHPLRQLRDRVAPLALARMAPSSFVHPTIDALKISLGFVETFTGPSAIVWGDRDPVLGRAFSRVQAEMPRAVVTRTKAGHFLQEEVPDVIAANIRAVSERLGSA